MAPRFDIAKQVAKLGADSLLPRTPVPPFARTARLHEAVVVPVTARRPPMRINAVNRAILDNQRAIMWALMYPGDAKKTLHPRFDLTSEMTIVRKAKPKRRRPRAIKIGGAFMNDVGEQEGWK
jgi:hypothetical protein